MQVNLSLCKYLYYDLDQYVLKCHYVIGGDPKQPNQMLKFECF